MLENKIVTLDEIRSHQQALSACCQCPNMIPPVITGNAVNSRIMTIGQAPGIHEARVQRPFGWTAGKTLFKWFASIGVEEEHFRERVYMSAVCRCFPGKKISKSGKVSGDRVPDKQEIETCFQWLGQELDMLQPDIIIPIGKLAILQFMQIKTLVEVVGGAHPVEIQGLAKRFTADVIPLPHPSGLSTWHNMEPGKTLLKQALDTIQLHPVWQQTMDS